MEIPVIEIDTEAISTHYMITCPEPADLLHLSGSEVPSTGSQTASSTESVVEPHTACLSSNSWIQRQKKQQSPD
ncbi:zinc finger protein 501-like [Astyanax mexicanus]|nr:zinc finger protein 501-like [Astyanax mexicanus]